MARVWAAGLTAAALVLGACASGASSPTSAPPTVQPTTTAPTTIPITTTTAKPRPCENSATPRRVHPIGDSLTAGSTFFESYRAALWSLLITAGGQSSASIDFVGTRTSLPVGTNTVPSDGDYDAVGGFTTGPDNGTPGANVYRHIDTYVAEPGTANFGTGKDWITFTDPDIVLLNIGSNDDEADRAAVRRRLDDLTRLIRRRAPDAIVILSSLPPNAKPYVQARLVGEEAREIAATSDGRVLFADLYTAMKNGNPALGITAIDEVLDRPSPSPEGLPDTIHFNASGAGKLAAAWYPTVMRALAMDRCAPPAGVDPAEAPNDRSQIFAGEPEFSVIGVGAPVVTGIRVRIDSPGTIEAIRWYKDPADTGPHVATLWRSLDTQPDRIRQVVASDETPSGWQSARFPTPIPVVPGYYVAAVSHSTGTHTVTPHGLSARIRSGPLEVPADDPGTPNGVYTYSEDPGAYPIDSFRAANYWVDVIFRPAD